MHSTSTDTEPSRCPLSDEQILDYNTPITPPADTPADSSGGGDPDEVRPRPRISAKLPYDAIGRLVAAYLPKGQLYRYNGRYITIIPHPEQETYETREMTPVRFVTWVAKYINFVKSSDPDAPSTSLSPAMADIVLNDATVEAAVPEVDVISPIRLPVGRRDPDTGRWTFKPAEPGYDPATRIYTIDSLPIDWTRIASPKVVRNWWLKMFSEFPLDGGDIAPLQSRSLGACVTAMLGQFLHLVIDYYPIIIINANQRGTGKSFLATTLLAPVYGQVYTANFVEDDNEFRKTLNAMLAAGNLYCYLDDLKTLVSNTINRFVTSAYITDRALGTNSMVTLKNRMQFVATGNNMKSSADVVRRSLSIDLFCAADSVSRDIVGEELNADKILTRAWRSEMLRALWSLVRGWELAGCPQPPPDAKFKRLPSFGLYSDLAATIAIWAGFANPFTPPLLAMDTGDAMGDATEELIIHLATLIRPNTPHHHTGTTARYTVQEIMGIASDIGKLDIIVGAAKSPNVSLGIALRARKGREYRDECGRKFRFGDRRTSASTIYYITILSEPTQTIEDITGTDEPDDDMFAPVTDVH